MQLSVCIAGGVSVAPRIIVAEPSSVVAEHTLLRYLQSACILRLIFFGL